MEHYKETFETWNKAASFYQEKFMDLEIYNETYDFFCNCMKTENAKVLDIGCGPGNIIRYIFKKCNQFQIIGIDVSPNMVELAKRNNPTAEFRILDCREISDLETQFDAIICGFCLPYLSVNDAEKLVFDIFHLLKLNGHLYLSFVEGNPASSGFLVNSLGDRVYFQYYQAEDVTKSLLNTGFSIVKDFKIVYQKAPGIEEMHTVLIARKENAG